MELPEGVERVCAKGRTYYYWNPHRGTARQGERIPLPSADIDPAAFWTEVKRRQAGPVSSYPTGSVGWLVGAYRASSEFQSLSASTRASYGVSMRRFERREAWGLLSARALLPVHVKEARDLFKDTPSQANHMLAVGRTIWDWGIPLGYVDVNPFDKVDDFALPDTGHVPWPAWAIDYVRQHAPADLVRMVRLGVMTCQRESDLIRMGPDQRERSGLWCRPKKTRRRRRSFCIPLAAADALELDRWAETPLVFTAQRWKAPIERHRADLYLYSPRGAPYTETSLRARWHRWLKRTAEGREVCRRWQDWIASQARKYEWDIRPEDSLNPTIHGLRGTGILARFEIGFDVDQIRNDIGMSRQMVEHYMRFRDQLAVGAGGAGRLRLVEGGHK